MSNKYKSKYSEYREFYNSYNGKKVQWPCFIKRLNNGLLLEEAIIKKKKSEEETLIFNKTEEEKKIGEQLDSIFFNDEIVKNNLSILARVDKKRLRREELLRAKIDYFSSRGYDIKFLSRVFAYKK